MLTSLVECGKIMYIKEGDVMNRELYNEMLGTKEGIERYLNQRSREFRELQMRLNGIGGVISVDNVSLLANLPEIKSQMEKLSSDYLNAKKALDVMKAIISEVLGQPDKSIQTYNLLKEQLSELGIVKVAINEDVAVLSKRA